MSDNGHHDLPPGWVWTRLGHVADVVGGGTPSTNDPANYEGGDIAWITPADLSGYTDKYIAAGARSITEKGLQESSARLMPPGTVLLSSRAPVGYVVIASQPMATNQGFKSFVLPGELDSSYVYYYLKFAKDLILTFASGTTFLEVSGKNAAQIPLPVAPIPEQRRIVAAIEEQFTRLDAAVAALKRTRANLKRYRASVLAAACSGRLVPTEAELARREGRDYEPADRLLDARAVRTETEQPKRKRAGRLWGAGVVPNLTDEEHDSLPEGWAWTKVRALGFDEADTVQVGPMSMRSKDFIDEGGVPVLNVGCVQWGRFDESKINRLPESIASDFGRYLIEPGDVLFTRSGTVGRCAVARSHHSGWLMTFHLLRARPDPDRCLSEYLRTVFEGAQHIRRQTREASIGTTRAGFNTNLLADLDIPLPPLAEQQRIVAEVERRLSVVEELETTVAHGLARAERLRQAVLRRAFAGKLVPQDPTDEPAGVLLERIRAEQAAQAANGTGRGTRRRGRTASGQRSLFEPTS